MALLPLTIVIWYQLSYIKGNNYHFKSNPRSYNMYDHKYIFSFSDSHIKKIIIIKKILSFSWKVESTKKKKKPGPKQRT